MFNIIDNSYTNYMILIIYKSSDIQKKIYDGSKNILYKLDFVF